MAKKQEANVEVVVEEVAEKKNVLVDSAHKVILIGFGAIGMGQDMLHDGREELNKLFNKLVGRGEEMEKEGRAWIKDIMNRGKKEVEEEVAVKTA